MMAAVKNNEVEQVIVPAFSTWCTSMKLGGAFQMKSANHITGCQKEIPIRFLSNWNNFTMGGGLPPGNIKI